MINVAILHPIDPAGHLPSGNISLAQDANPFAAVLIARRAIQAVATWRAT
jgi:hypothetical protein